MKRLIPAALAALSLTSCGIVSAQAAPLGRTVTVTRVVDGDTAELSDGLKVRILGVDAPEVRPAQCWAREATAFAKTTLLGQRVQAIGDPTQQRLDRYGRALLYLQLPDGRDFSVEAARAGAVRSYVYGGEPVQRHAQIVAAEAEAKQARRGMWGACG